MAKFEMRWEAPEYEHHEKDVSWYWVSIILAALLIAFAVWQKDFLFGFFVVIAELLVIIWADRPPRVVTFILSDEHLQIGDGKMHLMREFSSWSTDHNDADWSDIHFQFRSRWHFPLRVIVPRADLDEFRMHLRTALKEVPHDMSFVDAIEKLIHF